jgi:hypothetical protein
VGEDRVPADDFVCAAVGALHEHVGRANIEVPRQSREPALQEEALASEHRAV